MSDKPRSFAEELAREGDLLRRRFVHHTRPKGPLTLEQAKALCERMGEATDLPTLSKDRA
jgi:hypothetical protein